MNTHHAIDSNERALALTGYDTGCVKNMCSVNTENSNIGHICNWIFRLVYRCL
jgi:hypothetical protein